MSITLEAADTITGVAGSATAITYTIFGDEVAAGADSFKVLAQGQLPAAVGTLYTVPASTATIVKQIHLVNGTAGPVTARLNVKGTAAANAILPAITILAGGFAIFADDGWNVYNDQGQKLGVGATGAAGDAGAAGADGLATSGTPAVVLSTTAAAGVAATALATDAQIIAFDATDPSTQAFGDAAAAGAAAVTARRDHKHAMPASPLGLPLALTGAVAATRYVGGTASGAPASGTFAVGDFIIDQSGSIYICTVAGSPGTWVAVSGGSGIPATLLDAKGDLIAASAADTAARVAVGADGTFLEANAASAAGVRWGTPAGGSLPDPVALMLGTPDTAYEFETTSLTGLTAIGTATAEDADTTVPGHYYVKRAASSGVALTGRYAAVSAPCTVVAKLTAHNIFGANFVRFGGLFIGEATPGKVDAIHVVYNSGFLATAVAYTNPTTFSSTRGVDLIVSAVLPIYYAIVATSTTNVAYYYSFDGYLWVLREAGVDPSMTIGSAGIVVDPEQTTRGAVGAFEYLRIWNSAKTLITG